MDSLAKRFPNLSIPQFKAAAALATGESMSAAARAAGVDRGTLTNWRNEKEFNEALMAARHEGMMAILDDLKDISRMAVTGIREIIVGEHTPPTVRIHACMAVLNRLERLSLPEEHWDLFHPVPQKPATFPNRSEFPGQNPQEPATFPNCDEVLDDEAFQKLLDNDFAQFEAALRGR